MGKEKNPSWSRCGKHLEIGQWVGNNGVGNTSDWALEHSMTSKLVVTLKIIFKFRQPKLVKLKNELYF